MSTTTTDQGGRVTAGLLPCPFCGSKPSLSGTMRYLLCDACGTMGPDADNIVEAMELWNRRVAPAPAPEPAPRDAAKAETPDIEKAIRDILSKYPDRTSDALGFIGGDVVDLIEGGQRSCVYSPPAPQPAQGETYPSTFARQMAAWSQGETYGSADDYRIARKLLDEVRGALGAGEELASVAAALDAARAAGKAEGVREGMERAAQMLDRKLEVYDREHGSTDPETNVREYGTESAREYAETLSELADEIRSAAAATGEGAGA